jgi:hypothetical protein
METTRLGLSPKFRAKNGVSTIEKQGVDKPSFARK